MKQIGHGMVLASLTLGACTVGPEFHQPAPPQVSAYLPDGREAADLRLDPDRPIIDPWWRSFDCPALDGLIDRGLSNSPQVDAAQERLRSAQALLRAGYGSFFPQAGVSFDATRERYSSTRLGVSGAGSVFSLFTPSVGITYLLDLFGGNRRMIEELRASAMGQQQSLRATRLTLAGNIAATAMARAAFHEQAMSWQAIVEADEAQLAAAQARVAAGTLPYSGQLALAQQAEAARASLHMAQVRATQADDLLAVLIGDPPASASLPPIALAAFHLPEALPLRLPSRLVRQRPDILMAEASAHAASANIGVATAAMLPQITLSAGAGSSTNSMAQLFGSGTGVWSYAEGVTAPLFEGGTLINRRAAARADFAAAMAVYRQTVLGAFGQVADALTANSEDGAADAALTRSAEDAYTAYELARTQGRADLISTADLGGSRAAWQQARINALAARAAHLQDVVALYVALGGGDVRDQAKVEREP